MADTGLGSESLEISGKDLEIKQGKMSTYASIKEEKPDFQEEDLPKKLLPKNCSEVGCNVGITIPIASYTTLRVDVLLKDYCMPEDKLKVYDELKDMAAKKLKSSVDEIKKLVGV